MMHPINSDLNDLNDKERDRVLRLLEEKLVVERKKRKVGEIVVRKVVETRMVQIPVRREKLIVEQIGSQNQQLAEIDLGEETITGVETVASHTNSQAVVRAEFPYPELASDALRAFSFQKPQGCRQVRVEIVLDEPQLQEMYQTMFDRWSGKTPNGKVS
jgi:hypothetical protein